MTSRGLVAPFLALALALAGCASFEEGNDQTILLASNPTAAACEVARNGETIARVDATPMTVTIASSPDPLTVTCRLSPYPDATVEVVSNTAPGAFGNWAAGGSKGRAIDRALLGNFRYPGRVVVSLAPPDRHPRPLPLAYR